jgi:IS605 OrfB family transposase
MRKTYKYRIYLTNGQQRILNTMLEECRWVYNQMLEAHEFAYEHSLKCNRYDLINLLPGWKESRPSLKLVHSQVLQNIALRLDLAFQAFFRRVKAGEQEAGYPRYKKFDRYRSITYPQYGNVENPRFFRHDEADLKRAQKLKDAASTAQNWPENARRKKALARIHERIRFRREDFAHKRSRELVNGYQVIAFEELEPQQMGRSRGMRKSIADVAWTQLIQYACNKAEEAGRTVVLVNPRDTSKMCSNPNCGKLVKKDLSERVHNCPHCGLVLDRDQNAALNILRLGLQHLRL